MVPLLNTPQAKVVQAAPFCASVQVTPAFAGSFFTVAVNCGVVPAGSKALIGDTAMVIASSVTLAEPVAAFTAAEVATTSTVVLLVRGVAGAV